jgi:hypothetical protein
MRFIDVAVSHCDRRRKFNIDSGKWNQLCASRSYQRSNAPFCHTVGRPLVDTRPNDRTHNYDFYNGHILRIDPLADQKRHIAHKSPVFNI